MSDVLRLQNHPDDTPAVPSEEKMSMVSVFQCYNSAVSVVMCQAFGRF